jgi:hypothetical protein
LIFHCTDHLAQIVGPADPEWRKEGGVFVHNCQPAVSFKSEVWQPTPMIYMSSRMHLNANASFKRGDVLGDGLIFVAGLVLAEPEDFLVSGEFTPSRESLLLHNSFSSGPVFIAWSEQDGLHVLVRNAISNL